MAVAAMVVALGLTGLGATPFIVQGASATAAADPPVDPCEAGEACDPEVTVTVTTTLPTPTPDDPETTVTRTVTKSPPKTSTPAPKKTKSSDPAPTPPPSAPSQNLQPVTSQSVEVPPASTSPSTEASVSLPPIVGSETPSTVPSSAPPETSASEPVQLEVRAAQPEFDQLGLTRRLSIPALILVLLALFAVLIFEGRLRRMAHAAAVRKAGPQAIRADIGMGPQGGPGYPGPGYPGGPGQPGYPGAAGYPAGPGYATSAYPPPGYPTATAYAPIISFVPVHTYPSGEVQYGAVYQDPGAYAQQGFAADDRAAPPTEAVVLHPDEFDSYSHGSAASGRSEGYRAPFEPLVPPEPPPADIPAGGSAPYGDGSASHSGGPPDHPVSSASAAETGDSEPWQQTAHPFDPEHRATRPDHLPPTAHQPGAHQPTAHQPTAHQPGADLSGAEQATVEQATVEQPMPGQEGRQRDKRGFWRRSK